MGLKLERRQRDSADQATAKNGLVRLSTGPFGPRNAGAIYAWVAVIIVFGILSPQQFLNLATVKEVLNQYSIAAVTGLALVLPLATGLFDLSVGATAGLAGIASAWVLANVTTNIAVAVLVGVGVALLAGAVNCFVVLVLGVDSFIGTLATSSIYTAIVVAISGDEPISKNVNGAFGSDIALRNWGGFTFPVFYMIIIMLILAYVLEATVAGRYMYAIGFDREVARLGGVKVRSVQATGLITCALLAGLAGIAETASLGAGSPSVGSDFLLPSFTAAFLGATQFRRGRFNPWGTVVATLLVGTADVGLLIAGYPAWTQDVFDGVVLIVAVTVTTANGLLPLAYFRRLARRRAASVPGSSR